MFLKITKNLFIKLQKLQTRNLLDEKCCKSSFSEFKMYIPQINFLSKIGAQMQKLVRGGGYKIVNRNVRSANQQNHPKSPLEAAKIEKSTFFKKIQILHKIPKKFVICHFGPISLPKALELILGLKNAKKAKIHLIEARDIEFEKIT